MLIHDLVIERCFHHLTIKDKTAYKPRVSNLLVLLCIFLTNQGIIRLQKKTKDSSSSIPTASGTTYPHFTQVPVVVVRLVLVSKLSAKDDAILPTLRTQKHTLIPCHLHRAQSDSYRLTRNLLNTKTLVLQCSHNRSPLDGTGESTTPADTNNLSMQVRAAPTILLIK